MIAWLAWLCLAPLLVLADGFLLERLPARLDLSLAVVVCAAFACRSATLPGLLLTLALARAALTGGGLAAQYLALALPVAVVRPLRAVFDEGSFWLRALVAPALAAALPALLDVFARLGGEPVDSLPVSTKDLITAAIVAPCLAALLERTPPLSAFALRARRRRSKGDS